MDGRSEKTHESKQHDQPRSCGSEDFAAIDRCGCRQASCEKLHFDEHRAFGSAYFLELDLSCQQLEQNIPALFTDPACGHVLRAKGFVQDENGWVELNATADGLTANAIPKGQEVLIVIGEGLEKERIEVRLKGEGGSPVYRCIFP